MNLSAFDINKGKTQQVKIKQSKIELYKENNLYYVKRTYETGIYLKSFASLRKARNDYRLQCGIASYQ